MNIKDKSAYSIFNVVTITLKLNITSRSFAGGFERNSALSS